MPGNLNLLGALLRPSCCFAAYSLSITVHTPFGSIAACAFYSSTGQQV